MKFFGYQFPHPVLGRIDDFEILPDITHDYRYDESLDNHVFDFVVDLKDEYLKKLIKEEKAVFVCEVTCSNTLYRKVFESFQDFMTFEINNSLLRNKVELQLFLLANTSIDDYSSDLFGTNYKGAVFSLEEGDIIAFFEHQSYLINTDASSIDEIIKISEHDDSVDRGVRYHLQNDYIQVLLHSEQFSALKEVRNNPEIANILISSIIVPALIYASGFVNESHETTMGDKRWYEVLKEKALEYYQSEYLDIHTVPAFVDKILQFPNVRLFDNLKEKNNA